MRDGIIAETKNSRVMKADIPETYEELKTLLAGSGLSLDLLMNEQGWQQLPTYLNKANLLTGPTEEAIWEDAQNRTVNEALKTLADVAYGRVATLNVTVTEPDGTPIPDVALQLDAEPIIGTSSMTGADGKLKISTNSGTHTLYAIYPVGYTQEIESKEVIITAGAASVTLASASRKAESTIFTITETKAFYIARFLSPIQLDLRGGGGSGCAIKISESGEATCQGGAGGYVTQVASIDIAGKLIRVYVGAGGASSIATGSTGTTSNPKKISVPGSSGGNTSITIDNQAYTASGGRGGRESTAQNTAGGANGGSGTGLTTNMGGAGRYLFDDSSTTRKGGGGGGAYLKPSQESDAGGRAGAGGGTAGATNNTSSRYPSSGDATFSGGSGGCALNSYTTSYSATSGKGGDGFVAFRKAA